jgi:1-deoxy-D-xylulose-5-phosphate synthase
MNDTCQNTTNIFAQKDEILDNFKTHDLVQNYTMNTEQTITSHLLDNINQPSDLKYLNLDDLKKLSVELREFILQSVSQTGGHLSSNLGTVEITVAIHHVFNTPHDRLIWDVGHQSYPHKILTGRKHMMHTLRQLNGLSGFPKRSESIYDAFGTAHSSTSISAATGMAKASQLQKTGHISIAVIGDGAMSAGMAFEAMNNAGIDRGLPLLVILNDNDMSISPAVGALNKYLARLLSGKFYAATKKSLNKVLKVAPHVLELAKKVEDHAKGMIMPATLFEEFGFNYIGPIDGHDLHALIPTLRNIQDMLQAGQGPQFLHIVTKKGQGYKMAEKDPILYHGPGKFNPQEGIVVNQSISNTNTGADANTNKILTYTQVFSEWICNKAAQEQNLIAITPAMREGSGLVEFEQAYPERYFDVGIAEQHALTFAAGLACEGLKPVVAIYSTFLQRAYDQLIHDIALQNLPVVFAIDRAGLVGADGATHAGNYDIAYMRCIPSLSILAPAHQHELTHMLDVAYAQNHPVAVRYPRGSAFLYEDNQPIIWGKASIVRETEATAISSNSNIKNKIAILAFGSMLKPCIDVSKNLNATLVNMRFIKPLDVTLLEQICTEYTHIITVEEGCKMGGAGSACLEEIHALNLKHIPNVLVLGLPDIYIDHGDASALLALHGLDTHGIQQKIEQFMQNNNIKQ